MPSALCQAPLVGRIKGYICPRVLLVVVYCPCLDASENRGWWEDVLNRLSAAFFKLVTLLSGP